MSIQSDNIDPHEQNTDTKLDEGGTNEVTASELVKNLYNVILLAFYFAIQNSMTVFNMIDGFVDEYEDESGIDTTSSSNEMYNSISDFYSPNGDANLKLLLNFNEADGSTTTTDESNSAHAITLLGNTVTDDAYKKFGNASLKVDGTTEGLSIPASTDWDWLENTVDDWTIDLFIKRNAISATQFLFTMYQDASNSIDLRLNSGNTLTFNGVISGTTRLSVASTATLTDTTNFHHIAVCKVGNDFGIYLDGTQIAVQMDLAYTLNMNVSLYIAGPGDFPSSAYFNGWVDSFRVTKSNIFSASPDAGLTDTISVPSSELINQTQNMTLISETQVAESTPTSARIVIFEEDVDSITLNTDLLAYISRDDGTTWTQATLAKEGNYATGKQILAGNVDISSQPSGTDMRYKLVTANNKDLKIHGCSLNWN